MVENKNLNQCFAPFRPKNLNSPHATHSRSDLSLCQRLLDVITQTLKLHNVEEEGLSLQL